MNMLVRNVILFAVATCWAVSAFSLEGGDYTVLDRDASQLRSAFNADRGKVRVMMYVSPTCGGCLRGVKQTQAKFLDGVDSTDVAAYVLWIPKLGAAEEHAAQATYLVNDDRATQYWDEHGSLRDAYDEMFGIVGRPCAGVFMVYAPDAEWAGAVPPQPLFFEDAHAEEFARKAGPQYDAARLANEVRRNLDAHTSHAGL